MFWSWLIFSYLIICIFVFYYTKEYRFRDRIIISILWFPLWVVFQVKKIIK